MGQDEIVVKHVAAHAGGIPCMYDDLIRVIAPRAAQNGPALLILAAYGDVFLDSYYPDGSEGHSFELELIYYPTTTVGGTPEGLKRPEPDEVLGTDFTNLGNDKEPYRQTFLIENHRDRDDYSGLIDVCKAFAQPTGTLLAGTDAVIDIDQWMRAFVLYSLCGINDAYTQGNNHNLIVHQRTTDAKFEALPWDMDFAWVLAVNSPLWGNQNLGRLTALPCGPASFLLPPIRLHRKHVQHAVHGPMDGPLRQPGRAGLLEHPDFHQPATDVRARAAPSENRFRDHDQRGQRLRGRDNQRRRRWKRLDRRERNPRRRCG
jgi:hypothetical protein